MTKRDELVRRARNEAVAQRQLGGPYKLLNELADALSKPQGAGMSEERAREILTRCFSEAGGNEIFETKDYSNVLHKVSLAAIQQVVSECVKVPEGWAKIDGDTPKDRGILVYGPLKSGGFYRKTQKWFRSQYHQDGGFWPVIFMVDYDEPTHWCELPAPPSPAQK